MTFKKLTRKIHLWLGLLTGLVVIIVAVTGCIYAFQKEIQDWTQPYRFVEEIQGATLPPSQLIAIAQAQLLEKKIKRLYNEGEDRAAYALFYGKGGYYYTVYLNQYTGEVLKVKNMRKDFFTIILYLHISLLLPYGEYIIDYSCLIFLIMLITGIVLWWPKNKKASKQRFKIKWKANWKRTNYDLHSVFGFYISWIALFVVITGLVWAFGWVKESVYWVASGGKSIQEEIIPKSDTLAHPISSENPIDIAWHKVMHELPPTYGTAIFLPTSPTSPITIYTNPTDGTFYKMDPYYFDQFTAEKLTKPTSKKLYKNASVADKVIRMNYDIHTGGILGIAGKFIAFFVSLIVASLPVTGFLLWRGRIKKSKKTTKNIKIKTHRDKKYSSRYIN